MFITVKGFPKYEITKTGIIRNIATKKIKSQYIGSTGYYMVSFSEKNKSKPKRVHRMIAQTFIPNPENKPCVNHKDGDKLNNSIENLEWCTHEENMEHALRTSLVNNIGVKNGMCKLSEAQVKVIKGLLSQGVSQYKIAKRIGGVSRSAILKIKLNQTWTHVQL